MNEMIDRVAQALIDKIGVPDAALAKSLAIAAIQAMREPTVAMTTRAERIGDEEGNGYVSSTTAEDVWRDMIDEAKR